MLHYTASPRVRLVALSMYYNIFIKTENIGVDENGRIICPYLLARAHIYFYITFLGMNDAMTCNIVAQYSAVQYKSKSHTTYLPP